MKRRALLSGAAASFIIPSFAIAQQRTSTSPKSKTMKLLKPKALQRGMTIGLVFPAGWTAMSAVEVGKAYLEQLGFRVVLGSNAGKQYGYFSATDKERAAEFMAAVENPAIDGIICARGGYGTMRMLELLDYSVIRKHPKVICGYSDITALINTIYQRSGLVTFHGPGALGAFSALTERSFLEVLTTDSDSAKKPFSPIVMPPAEGWKTLSRGATGRARGRLVGGNLTLLSMTTGTSLDINTKGALLFLEDVTEEPYRIDRMITQLLLAGKLQVCAGIVIGQWTDCEPKDAAHSFTVEEVLEDRLQGLGIPIVTGLQFGHVDDKYTYPIGVQAELDAEQGTLTLLEPAVHA
ncbi:MAG: LD-carboxypeptidase [Bacteroidota bacterium]|nr:LD-carboxypeptidase [Candidatus Kapabacteria bacterium]MDW8219335.1 LD-carboxypeptidase [Bacteroidota bacterium]